MSVSCLLVQLRSAAVGQQFEHSEVPALVLGPVPALPVHSSPGLPVPRRCSSAFSTVDSMIRIVEAAIEQKNLRNLAKNFTFARENTKKKFKNLGNRPSFSVKEIIKSCRKWKNYFKKVNF